MMLATVHLLKWVEAAGLQISGEGLRPGLAGRLSSPTGVGLASGLYALP